MKSFLKPINLLWLAIIPVVIIAARVFPWGEIVQILRSLTALELIGLLVVNLVILLLFCVRWWLILRAYGYVIPYTRLSGYRMAGFAISYFTPGTQFGGEPLQVYLVQARHSVPAGTSLAAVAVDRLIELFVNFSFLVLGVLIIVGFGLIPGLARLDMAGWLGAVLALPLLYFGALWADRQPLGWVFSHMPKSWWKRPTLAKLPQLVASTERQMAFLFRNHPMLILSALFISALVWGLMVFEYWLMVTFLGAPLSPLQAVAGYTATRIAFLTPLPGGVGVLEAGQALAMQAFGYTSALGISISLLMRVRDFLIGLTGLWIGGLVGARRAPLQEAQIPAASLLVPVSAADMEPGLAGDPTRIP